MKVRLIAFDLDGTILRGDKSLTARSFRALCAAAEAGALIVPATGRIYKGVPAPLREKSFSRYFITVNGALLLDAKTDEALYRAEIPCELALRLYRIVRRDSRIGFEASNHYYYTLNDLMEKVVSCSFILRELGVPPEC